MGNRDVELWKYEVLMEVTVVDRWAVPDSPHGASYGI